MLRSQSPAELSRVSYELDRHLDRFPLSPEARLLKDQIEKTIGGFELEYSMTLAEVLGVLEEVKVDMWNEYRDLDEFNHGGQCDEE